MGPDRPSFQSIYLELARLLAARSTCKQRRVGTVITSPDYRRVLAVGYGGNASGLPNRCDRDDPDDCGCLHSEENAVINCDAPRDVSKVVFVTDVPCVACAKRLVNLGNVLDLYTPGDPDDVPDDESEPAPSMPSDRVDPEWEGPAAALRVLSMAGIRVHRIGVPDRG
jgi:dCMP deaminase